MIAANIMTTDVTTLESGKSMLEAIKLLSNKKIRQIPVTDPSSKKVVGVITPRKIMKAILPKYISEGMLEDVKFAPELPEFVEHIDDLKYKNVDDFIDKDYVAVKPDTHTMEIAAIFVNVKKPVESILVVDDHGRLLGVISPWDVFKRLWEYSEKKS